jgi:hypothetical protein
MESRKNHNGAAGRPSKKAEKMPYLAEMLEAAVRRLVGEGPVKQRLGEAYALHLDNLRESDVPAPLRAAFVALDADMHRSGPVGKESSIKITVQKMSSAEASAHAETIVKLYAEVLHSVERGEPLKVVHSEDTAPRYIAGGQ